MNCFVRSQRGFSTVTILVMVGAGLTVSMGFISLLTSQEQDVKRLELKVAAQDISASIKKGLNDGASCLQSFASPFQIDDGSIGNADYSVSIGRIVEAGSSQIVVQQGEPVPRLGFDLTVSGLRAANFARLAADVYTFDLLVTVSSPTLGTVANLRIEKISMATDPASPAGAKTPVSCVYETGGDSNCREVRMLAPDTNILRIPCGADEMLLSGGGYCTRPDGTYFDPKIPDEAGWLVINRPYTSGLGTGWELDCYNSGATDTTHAKGYAYCCRR